MGANQSYLSGPGYGYDMVVSTTLESINATLKYNLRHHFFPVVKGYFIRDANEKTVAISYENLMASTKGTDPLKVGSYKIDGANKTEIENVVNSKLVYAFEAAIGIPPNFKPINIPDIIAFAAGSGSVNFTMICAQFTIVAPNTKDVNEPYVTFLQPNATPWLITFVVPLKTITDNTNLPPAVQKQLDSSGPGFSVQQLVVDLNSAPNDASKCTIRGVQTGTPLYIVLTDFLNNNYLAALKSAWQPVFFYAFTKNTPPQDSSSLVLTNMKIELSQYTDPANGTHDNPRLNTLNYLCATNGNGLPQPNPFSWNWVEQSKDQTIPDGVIAINRNTFARYLQDHITPYVSANCLLPQVKVFTEGAGVMFQCSFSRGQSPTVTIAPAGGKVITYTYSKSAIDGAGSGDSLGELSFATTCNATVSFSGNTIVIEQSLLLHVDLWSLATNLQWCAINKTITDTYTLAVTQNGNLTASQVSVPVDKSEATPHVSRFTDWFTDINEVADYVAQSIQAFLPTSLNDIPVQVAQQFVFPAGNAFTFELVGFSDYQDLVTHITYVQPG